MILSLNLISTDLDMYNNDNENLFQDFKILASLLNQPKENRYMKIW